MKDMDKLPIEKQAEIYKIKYRTAEKKLQHAYETIKKLEDKIHDLEVNGIKNLSSQEKLRLYEKEFHSVRWHNNFSNKSK